MAERCPDCGRLPGMASDRCGALVKFPTLLEVTDCRRVTNERLRAKLTKLEAVVEAQAKVIATGEAYLECDGSPAELAAFYDAAKAELEKVR